MPSGSILKVASSTRIDMAVAMSLKSLASDTLSLNIRFSSPLNPYLERYKRFTLKQFN
jgi:hypothetical protein